MNWNYLYTFTQTCALEFPFYAYFLRPRSWPRVVASVVALNALTHPFVFFGLMSLRWPLVADIAVAEVFAFLVEALACYYFLRLRARTALGASLMANLCSWQVGPLVTYFLFIERG